MIRQLNRLIIPVLVVALLVPPVVDFGIGQMKPTQAGCVLTRIVDGDTIKFSCPNTHSESGRILGYDTAEKNARCVSEYILAMRAIWVLRWAIWTAQDVEIEKHGRDRYGRHLIKLALDGVDVSDILIGSKLARPYRGGKRQSWCDGAGG